MTDHAELPSTPSPQHAAPGRTSRPGRLRGALVTAAGLILVAILAAGPTTDAEEPGALGLSMGQSVSRASAHGIASICFVADAIDGTDDAVYVTVTGPRGQIGSKPGLADGKTEVCFEAPPVPPDQLWRNCEPQKTITETYAGWVTSDAFGNQRADGSAPPSRPNGAASWQIERVVDDPGPRPEECEDLDGDWTWTFKAGILECAKLPMKVTLPGFSDSVRVETDGVSMTVTGGKKRETIRLVIQPDTRIRGEHRRTYMGFQDASELLDAQGDLKGKYTIAVIDSEHLEGSLTLDKARYQGDVCSIRWPFRVDRDLD